MLSTERGNHPWLSLLALVPWLWWLLTVSSCPCNMSLSPFVSPTTFSLCACLPALCYRCLWLVLCTCAHTHTHTWAWLKSIAGTIHTGSPGTGGSWRDVEQEVTSHVLKWKNRGGRLRSKEKQTGKGNRKGCALGEKTEAGGSDAAFSLPERRWSTLEIVRVWMVKTGISSRCTLELGD